MVSGRITAPHSLEHAVLHVVSTCYNNISNKQYTDLIILDLKKAFDSVTHTILLRKLDHYGMYEEMHKNYFHPVYAIDDNVNNRRQCER